MQFTERSLSSIVRELATDDPRNPTHPAFLSAGMRWNAYRVELDGHTFVAKTPYRTPNSPDVLRRVQALEASAGIDRTEQLVGVFPNQSFVVTTHAPGKDFTSFSADDFARISDDDIRQAFLTTRAMSTAAVGLDPNPTNVLYDPDKGFFFIDLLHRPTTTRLAFQHGVKGFIESALKGSKENLTSDQIPRDEKIAAMGAVDVFAGRCVELLPEFFGDETHAFLDDYFHVQRQVHKLALSNFEQGVTAQPVRFTLRPRVELGALGETPPFSR